ncbi:unnamed protein product, partial [Urochloa humidicola]
WPGRGHRRRASGLAAAAVAGRPRSGGWLPRQLPFPAAWRGNAGQQVMSSSPTPQPSLKPKEHITVPEAVPTFLVLHPLPTSLSAPLNLYEHPVQPSSVD